MKLILLICAVTLMIACSTGQPTNTFQSLTIEAGNDTAVIHQRFVAAFDAIDKDMSVVSHSFVATEIVELNKNGKVECVPGYLMEIREKKLSEDDESEDIEVFEETHTFAYFLPLESQSPFVVHDPIDLALDENGNSDNAIENYSVPGGCKIIGVRTQTPSHAGNSGISVTFYSWSPAEKSFIKLNTFQTFEQHVDESNRVERMIGSISFGSSNDGRLDLTYIVNENGKETTDLYTWGEENFIQKSSSSPFVRTNSYESITFDADNDTASIHQSFVKSFSAIDSAYQLRNHTLKTINLVTIDGSGNEQQCIAGYLLEMSTVDPDYQGNDSGQYDYAYFFPVQSKGPFTALSTLDLYDTDGSTVTNNDLVDYEIGNECHVLAINSSRSNDLDYRSGSLTLYAWSAKDNRLKEINTFEMSSHQGYTQDTVKADDMSAEVSFLASTDSPYQNLQYTVDKTVTLFKWNGTTFVKK